MSKKNKKKSSVKAISESELELQQDSQDLEQDNVVNEEAPTLDSQPSVEEAPLLEEKEEVVQEEAPIENDDLSLDEDLEKDQSLLEDEPNTSEEVPASETDVTLVDDNPIENQEETSLEVEEEANSVEPPVEEIHEHGPKEKKKMDKKKKKIILISTLSVILAIAVILAITLPIYFHFKGKVMINSQEDFQNVSKGDHYVLNKDIVVSGDLDLSSLGNYSIDLNKHTLTVEGDLKYGGDISSTINIGNTKKKEYLPGGILIVKGNMIAETPNASLNILSATQANGANLQAKNITLESLTTSASVDIQASSLLITGTVQTDPTSFVNVRNGNVVVSGVVNSTINGTNISLKINPSISVDKIILDDLSNAEIYGAIKTSINGGKKVAMLNGHSCGEYNNILNLALYRADAKDYTIKNCARVVYVDKLETPADFLIEERANGKIFAVAAIVPNAINYKFTIDDQEFIVDTHYLDISEAMTTGGPKSHIITVTPLGNFDFATFEQNEANIQYVNGDTSNTEFKYTITLDLPENLIVDDKTEEDKILLNFNSVTFASGYTIVINGSQFTVNANPDLRVQSIDITDRIENVGTYSIRVSAFSEVAEINSSGDSMTSYTKFTALSTVSGVNAKIDNGTLKVSYEAPENAKSYIIYAENALGERIELGRTALTELSVDASLVEGYTKVVVIAQGQGYYLSSDEVSTEILRI